MTIDPIAKNGLRVRSQVMTDKAVTMRRELIGRLVGHLDDKDIGRLTIAGIRHGSLVTVLAIGDWRSNRGPSPTR